MKQDQRLILRQFSTVIPPLPRTVTLIGLFEQGEQVAVVSKKLISRYTSQGRLLLIVTPQLCALKNVVANKNPQTSSTLSVLVIFDMFFILFRLLVSTKLHNEVQKYSISNVNFLRGKPPF